MKQPKQYLHNRVEAIIHHFQIPPFLYTNEDFHTIRVEIKKIYAFLDLLKHCNDTSKNHFNCIKTTFQAAGKTRNTQLALEHLNKYSPQQLVTYRHWLESSIRQSKLYFFSSIQLISYKEIYKENNRVIQKTKHLSKYDINYFLSATSISMLQIWQHEPINEENLHKIRILLKRYLYILKFSGSVQHKKQINTITKLSDKMGKWHDAAIIEKRIVEYIKKSNHQSIELTMLLKYLLVVIKEKNHLFEQCFQEFGQLIG